MLLSNNISELKFELLWWQKQLNETDELQFKLECSKTIEQIKNKINEVTNN
jgi:hypothetical protein